MSDHTNKQLKEQLQEAKNHFNKEIEILKINKMEILEENNKPNKKLNEKHHQKTRPLGRQNLRQ